MSDLTLISKVTPEAINENLKKRFEAGEIYVWSPAQEEFRLLILANRRTLDMCSSLSTLFGTVGTAKDFTECRANIVSGNLYRGSPEQLQGQESLGGWLASAIVRSSR